MALGKKPNPLLFTRKVAMTENPSNPIGPNESTQSERQLESWKEIAVYLGRDVSTVRRWEKYERLPVRRYLHQARSTVYAYPSELETWKQAREPGLEKEVSGPIWRRPIPAIGLTLAMLLALVTFASGPLLTPPNALAQGSGGMTVRQVWAGPGVDIGGGPSPDSRYLTYTDWFTGNLAARNLSTGQERRLTHKGSWADSREFSEHSIVSPDSRQIAYGWFAGKSETHSYELRLTRFGGSKPRVLYANREVTYLRPFSWSGDGQEILTLLSKKDKTHQIAMISVADGSVRILKTLDWRYPQKMSLSPDNRYIVYDFPPQEDSPERDIFLLAADASREITLIKHPANDLRPIWAPDGKSVVFMSDRTGAPGIWVVPVSKGKPQTSPQLVKSDTGEVDPMAFTGDGSLYYGFSTSTFEIYIAELDPKSGRVLAAPTKPIERFEGAHWWPDWSPDGKYLAYGLRPYPMGGRDSGVVVIRSLASGQERELSPRLDRWKLNSWSPDGRFLLVTGTDSKGRSGFHRMDAQTGDLTLLVRSEPGQYFSPGNWSLDGKSLFYQSNDRESLRRSILVRDLETGQVKELYGVTAPESMGHRMALSPDGRQLAFRWEDRTNGVQALRLLPTTGGKPRELLRVQAPEVVGQRAFAWSRDGQYVLFTKRTGIPGKPRTVLCRVAVDGGKAEELKVAVDGHINKLAIHPDGRHLAFQVTQYSAEVWVMENFLP